MDLAGFFAQLRACLAARHGDHALDAHRLRWRDRAELVRPCVVSLHGAGPGASAARALAGRTRVTDRARHAARARRAILHD